MSDQSVVADSPCKQPQVEEDQTLHRGKTREREYHHGDKEHVFQSSKFREEGKPC